MADVLRHREKVESLADLLDEKGLNEIEYESGGVKIRVTRFPANTFPPPASAPPPAAGPAASATEVAPPATEPESHLIRSPIVGTFYEAPSPDAAPFVSVGDRVSKGEVVCIIEAMKLMNEIEADRDGVVAELLVKNGQGVGYEEPLFRIAVG